MKYIKSICYTFGIILGFNVILTILNYFNILTGIPFKILYILITITSIFIGSFILGINTNEKGYKSGFLFGIILLFIFLLFKMILKIKFNLIMLMGYALIIFISMIGSMIGINRKKV